MTNKNVKIFNFLKNNQEKLLLLLGFFLALSAGFFSGYFYSQSQIEKREVLVNEPDQNCKDLLNTESAKDSINSNSSSNSQNSPVSEAKSEQNSQENNNLQNKTGIFVASKNSNIYHKPDCRYAKLIKEENKIWFKSAQEAEERGYKPDKNCFK